MIDSALASAIPRLSTEGLSQRAIAARLGVSRSTVQRYLLDRTRGMSTDNLRRPKAFKLDVGDFKQRPRMKIPGVCLFRDTANEVTVPELCFLS